MSGESFWTDDLVSRLRLLWADDAMTARLIAEDIGTTRNAVLGKAHRLDLPDKKHTNVSLLARRIEVRRYAEKSRPKPAPTGITIIAKHYAESRVMRPAGPGFVAPKVNAGTSKTSPSYRNQLGFLPEMTVRERRDMLAEAVRNTAAMPVEA